MEDYIKLIMKKHKVSIDELAYESGLHRSTIYNMIRVKRVLRQDVVIILAELIARKQKTTTVRVLIEIMKHHSYFGGAAQ